MSEHNPPPRFPNRFINWAIALAGLIVLAAVQQLDASDLESELDTERREWAYAQQACWRFYGTQAQPEYDHTGTLICRTRRGEALAYRGAPK